MPKKFKFLKKKRKPPNRLVVNRLLLRGIKSLGLDKQITKKFFGEWGWRGKKKVFKSIK